MELANNIKAFRDRANMSQADLGNVFGISYQAISKWERGLSLPNADQIIRMCHLFDVSSDELLGLNQSRSAKIRCAAQGDGREPSGYNGAGKRMDQHPLHGSQGARGGDGNALCRA